MKKDTGLRFITSLIGLLLILTLNPILIAQDIQNKETASKDTSYLRAYKRLPILNGFRFIPSDIVKDPFIHTFMKLNLGVGTALDLKSYVKNLQGEVFDTLSGDISYLSGELEFQYAVNDWLAFNIAYGGAGRLGNNAYTLLTSGISYSTTFTLGGKIRILQNEKMFLSGSIDYSSSEVAVYSIYDFIKKIYENGGEIDSAANSLLEKETLPKAFINANYAYALTDWFGLLGVAGFGLIKTFDTVERGNYRLGAAAAIDFLNVDFIHFPIGILVSARYNKYSESGSTSSNVVLFGLRIGYTGHKDFDIGIENTYENLSYKRSEEKVKLLLTSFKMRYYF
jgi:hypothetical protein